MDLRALSVLAVIAYHLKLKWAGGGLLGVGIFFVISGYLISNQIILEWKTVGRIHLLKFWVRRIRRLMPTMFAMLLVVALWLFLVDPARLHGLRGEFLSSMFYINNWWLIYHNVSYFESFGPPSPIGHLWSLAIEEQFYLLWPILLVFGLKLIPYRDKLLLWILGVAGVSALAMAFIYVPGSDPSRVYYGTDTRAFALLIGAALAVVWPSWKVSSNVSSTARASLDAIGTTGVLTLLVFIICTNKYEDSLYRGGFLLLSILTAIVIAVLTHPASRLARGMGCKPLRWIGVRSYSLYIWHFPVILLSNPAASMDSPSFIRTLLQIVVSFLLASLSYKYVEEPFRRGRPKGERGLSSEGRSQPTYTRFIVPAALLLVLLAVVIGSGSLGQSEPDQPAFVEDQSQVRKKTDQPAFDERGNRLGEGITVIGDSIMINVAPHLERRLPGIVIDGQVSRQMSQAKEAIDKLQAQGQLGECVILELGTNGPFQESTLRSLLNDLGERKVLLVNTRVPKEWQNRVNEAIAEVADEFSHATVVDWYTASVGKDELFTSDGVHLNEKGAEYYATILFEAIKAAK